MNYKTYSPNTQLDAFVKCYWTLEAAAENNPNRQRIVPDGCLEMIFHFADLYKQFLPDGSALIQPRCFVFGQITIPLQIEPTGTTGIFSVRFRPAGFIPFASMPLKEMENRAVPMEVLFENGGKEISEAIVKAKTTEDRIVLIETFLLTQLRLPETTDRVARESVQALLQLNGQLRVEELAGQLNISRRQLERRFAERIGMSPKQLSKVIRLQAALQLMSQKQFHNLTSLSYETGYFDQAHFIKDFKEFTGISPKQFYADNLQMSTLFAGTD